MADVQATNDLETLQTWVGRTESVTETVSASWCQRVHDTLDRPGRIADGDVLAPLIHFTTHLGTVPQSQLDRDGHPKRGGFLPPVALPRRMWAGGRLTFTGNLHAGDEVTKTSTIGEVTRKTGRSGALCFVQVHHELSVGGEIRVTEEQDLVYREDPAAGAPTPEPKPAPEHADWSRTITPSSTLLFRYSALTFNSHRIHYDRDYATTVEGYPGLVFHGPLTATLLAELATTKVGRPLASFGFRAMSPLFDAEPFTISGVATRDGADLWAATPSGGLAMRAEATFA